MIILPIHKSLDWKNPPVITLLLILINVYIFTAYQLDDMEKFEDVGRYYFNSGLAEIEKRHYKIYLEKSDDTGKQDFACGPCFDKNWYSRMQGDNEFLKLLQTGKIITLKDEDFKEWMPLRQEYNQRYNAITTVKYSLVPADPIDVSIITHMFLHGDWGHLIGNMVFLLALGMLVEPTVSRKVFLVLYILAGLGSASFDFIFTPDRMGIGLGASGAIAGLMGAYAVLYGFQTIRFFFFILFYFDYFRSPAIILLPLWIGNELAQMALNPDSNVNFLAHLGGLVSGATLATIIKLFLKLSMAYEDKVVNREKSNKLLDKANALHEKQDFHGALPLYQKLLEKEEGSREVLQQYYECCRTLPDSDEFHGVAHKLMLMRDTDMQTDQLVTRIFNDYLKTAKPAPRLNEQLVCSLAHRFVRQRSLKESERLVQYIFAKGLKCANSQDLLTRFYVLLEEQNRTTDILKYRKLVESRSQA